ncbi:hypothetical protein [Streptomyces bikiniensis]|uniref:hypothetical protein n=1 Tax=Streptomyces bikiniensis TaxID=1896 RepID=UPI000A9C86C1|nr:hypothetical protein [Streptomyces bikiniensis]
MAMCERVTVRSSSAPASAATRTTAAANAGCDQPVSAITAASPSFLRAMLRPCSQENNL